jgi:hypothetical protein
MYKEVLLYRIIVFLLVFAALTVNAHTINLGGIVLQQSGQADKKATVTLVGQGLKDTTGRKS